MSTKERKLKEKENRKEYILSAAFSIMERQGIFGLSLDLIAKETELAKGTIYLYFKSKEEIISNLSLRARQSLFNEFKTIASKNLAPIDELKQIIIENFLFYKKSALNYNLVSLYEVNNNLIETQEMQQIGVEITELIVGMVNKAKANGTLNPKIDPMHFTFCLWGMTMGMMQLINVRGNIIQQELGLTEEKLMENYIESIIFGLTK